MMIDKCFDGNVASILITNKNGVARPIFWAWAIRAASRVSQHNPHCVHRLVSAVAGHTDGVNSGTRLQIEIGEGGFHGFGYLHQHVVVEHLHLQPNRLEGEIDDECCNPQEEVADSVTCAKYNNTHDGEKNGYLSKFISQIDGITKMMYLLKVM